MKKTKGEERRLTLGRGFWLYLALLVGALWFTQTLRAKASHVALIFAFLVGPTMLLYVRLAGAFVRVYVSSDSATITKGENFTFAFRVINSFFLPVPFVEAIMLLPQADCVRVRERKVLLSLVPFCACPFGNTVRFRFRGTYDIGVKAIYIYDLFRIFRFRVDVDAFSTVYVLPRRLKMPLSDSRSAADRSTQMQKKQVVLDKVEVSDVRDYRLGDTLKSIHWKLSSKSENNLVVREYNTGITGMTCIFCDLATHYPTSPPPPASGEQDALLTVRREAETLALPVYYADMNEYCADGVMELAISATEKELQNGCSVWLLWYDSRESAGACAYFLRSMDDFEVLYRQFASAPVGETYGNVTSLATIVDRAQDARRIYVVGAMDADMVSMFCDCPDGTEADILLYNPLERFADAQARQNFLDTCGIRLSEKGYRLKEERLPTLGDGKGGES